ncbi:hypothetical protein BDN70DRAFT_924589 [Pholiota conissans]|uniref:Uncharacterized protein n=1 Tax=Pholiota conissans TaxID=109636 RepID=A0A9P6CVQ9_9AGAR|nr:hypothetical protein BDN70DRAFT_924589 [Pholiota conissans]
MSRNCLTCGCRQICQISAMRVATASCDRVTAIPLATDGYIVLYDPLHIMKLFDTRNGDCERPFTPKSPRVLREAVMAFASTILDMDQPGVGLEHQSEIVDSMEKISCVAQTHDGIPVGNTLAEIVFTKCAPSVPGLSLQDAIIFGEITLDATLFPSGKPNRGHITIAYCIKPDNTAALVYQFDLWNERKGTGWRPVYEKEYVDRHRTFRPYISQTFIHTQESYHRSHF